MGWDGKAYMLDQFNWFISVVIAKGTTASRFYEEAERKGQFITKYVSGFMVINITFSAFGAALIDGLFNIFVRGNHDATDWYLPYKTM